MSSNNVVTGNLFHRNGSTVPWVYSPHANAQGIGLRLEGGGHNLIQGNTFVGGDHLGGPSGFQNMNLLVENSSGNLIGGPGPGEGNVIADNAITEGREFGVSISGGATGNTVGGYAPAEANVVSTVDLSADANRAIGNFIGVDRAGHRSGARNRAFGVWVSGDRSVIASNHIANAQEYGIDLKGNDSLVSQNVIVGNGFGPVSGNPGLAGAGIVVRRGTGNAIRANDVYGNGGLGIDLGDEFGTDGPDGPGDVGDGDTGPNNRQNTAIITSVARSGGQTVIYGTVRAPLTGSHTYNVEVFENNSCDPTGWGQGQRYLGSAETYRSFAPGTIGSEVFVYNVAGNRAGYFSATATDANGNTSEFSRCTRSKRGSTLRSNASGGTMEVFDRSAFSPGDQVTLCPGCTTEEQNQVEKFFPLARAAGSAGPGYIVLSDPTQFSHLRGEVIGVDSTPIPPACGDRLGDGVKATDALYVLQVAVGSQSGDECVADVDGNGSMSATDALIVLQVAVGQEHPMLCPICF